MSVSVFAYSTSETWLKTLWQFKLSPHSEKRRAGSKHLSSRFPCFYMFSNSVLDI